MEISANWSPRAPAHWHYPPAALYDDVLPCLEELRGRVPVRRDRESAGDRFAPRCDATGSSRFFEVWGVSDELGVGKPDPALFELAVKAAGVAPGASGHGRRPARLRHAPAAQVGMRAVWMLRGEAPDDPTPEQLAETDAAIESLADLPAELERLSTA